MWILASPSHQQCVLGGDAVQTSVRWRQKTWRVLLGPSALLDKLVDLKHKIYLFYYIMSFYNTYYTDIQCVIHILYILCTYILWGLLIDIFNDWFAFYFEILTTWFTHVYEYSASDLPIPKFTECFGSGFTYFPSASRNRSGLNVSGSG